MMQDTEPQPMIDQYGRELDSETVSDWEDAAFYCHIHHSWQPIETAPLHQTVILYCSISEPDGDPSITCGYLTLDKYSKPTLWCIEGDAVLPTHWMPLPEAPNA